MFCHQTRTFWIKVSQFETGTLRTVTLLTYLQGACCHQGTVYEKLRSNIKTKRAVSLFRDPSYNVRLVMLVDFTIFIA